MHLTDFITEKAGVESCPICGGIGFFLEENVPGSRSGVLSLCSCISERCGTCFSKGKPPFLDYDSAIDKMIPCFCHDARNNLHSLESMLIKSCIPPKYRFKFLDNIDITGDKVITMLAAHDWASELVYRWNEPNFRRNGMYLWGGTGSGKTLLACVILNELMMRYNAECRYVKINRDFLSALKDTYQKDSELHGQERSIEMEIADVDVLVIDDFGVQKESEWANAKLYDLIDARYEKEKLTLLTSNSPLVEWKDKGEGRIYSRLLEMTRPLHLDCPDYRLKFQDHVFK
ncbi:MAG: ATP-binding protein [Leptospira sp.]|nr:ATP-binding protein [Leptospira sp.]